MKNVNTKGLSQLQISKVLISFTDPQLTQIKHNAASKRTATGESEFWDLNCGRCSGGVGGSDTTFQNRTEKIDHKKRGCIASLSQEYHITQFFAF